MTSEIAIVLAVVLAATVLFATEWVAFDVTAVLVLVLLVSTGAIAPEDALSGFSNPATIAIASMLVLSMALNRTGVVDMIAERVTTLAKRSPTAATIALLGLVGLSSALINNTAVVAILIPVAIALAPALGRSPSKLLMPLSFISILGGVCTLVGTSTNLLVSSIASDAGLDPLGMFEVTPLGGLFLGAGFLYLLLVGPRVLPDRRQEGGLSAGFELAGYISELEVGADFSEVGERRNEDALVGSRDIDILHVRRDGRVLGPDQIRWRRGDVLRVRGSREALASLIASDDLILRPALPISDQLMSRGRATLCEVVVAAESDIVGHPLRESEILKQHGAQVLAVRHAGVLEHGSLMDRKVRAGDALLLLVDRDRIDELRRRPELVVASQHPLERQRRDRAWLAVLIMLSAIVIAATGLAPIAITALAAAALTVITGCITTEEAYRSINWKIIVMLAGVIPLGQAMGSSGAAAWLSHLILDGLHGFGPHAVLAGVLLLTMAMTNLMSNVAAAAFLVPLAVQTASALEVEARPLVMAVMFGASLSFLSPVGYQTNTLVFGPGQYRYSDYARLGAGLSLLCLLIGVIAIPLLWPF